MKRHSISLALGILTLALLIVSLTSGTTAMPIGEVFAALFGGSDEAGRIVVQDIRLPRALAAALAGFALGISGAALQGLLRNPLAEPGVLGVSATAALFAAATLSFGLAGYGAWVLPVGAIAGALFATAIIAIAALRVSSVVTLILIGVGLSSMAGALLSLLMNLSPNPFTLSDLINWLMGSVENRSFDDLALALPFILTGSLILLASRRGLAALTLGEAAAQSVGLNLTWQRILTVLGAGLATGGSVALAGAIGFVGIIAPHIVRPFLGHDPARTLLPSGLLGAALLLAADILIRIMPTPFELKLGVVAALIGTPIFIMIAIKARPVHD